MSAKTQAELEILAGDVVATFADRLRGPTETGHTFRQTFLVVFPFIPEHQWRNWDECSSWFTPGWRDAAAMTTLMGKLKEVFDWLVGALDGRGLRQGADEDRDRLVTAHFMLATVLLAVARRSRVLVAREWKDNARLAELRSKKAAAEAAGDVRAAHPVSERGSAV